MFHRRKLEQDVNCGVNGSTIGYIILLRLLSFPRVLIIGVKAWHKQTGHLGTGMRGQDQLLSMVLWVGIRLASGGVVSAVRGRGGGLVTATGVAGVANATGSSDFSFSLWMLALNILA